MKGARARGGRKNTTRNIVDLLWMDDDEENAGIDRKPMIGLDIECGIEMGKNNMETKKSKVDRKDYVDTSASTPVQNHVPVSAFEPSPQGRGTNCLREKLIELRAYGQKRVACEEVPEGIPVNKKGKNNVDKVSVEVEQVLPQKKVTNIPSAPEFIIPKNPKIVGPLKPASFSTTEGAFNLGKEETFDFDWIESRWPQVGIANSEQGDPEEALKTCVTMTMRCLSLNLQAVAAIKKEKMAHAIAALQEEVSSLRAQVVASAAAVSEEAKAKAEAQSEAQLAHTLVSIAERRAKAAENKLKLSDEVLNNVQLEYERVIKSWRSKHEAVVKESQEKIKALEVEHQKEKEEKVAKAKAEAQEDAQLWETFVSIHRNRAKCAENKVKLSDEAHNNVQSEYERVIKSWRSKHEAVVKESQEKIKALEVELEKEKEEKAAAKAETKKAKESETEYIRFVDGELRRCRESALYEAQLLAGPIDFSFTPFDELRIPAQGFNLIKPSSEALREHRVFRARQDAARSRPEGVPNYARLASEDLLADPAPAEDVAGEM